MAKPDYNQLGVTNIVDLTAVSEIVPGLFQGMRPASYKGYELVVSCEEFLAKKPMEGFMGGVFSVPMRDEDDFQIPTSLIEAAARAAHTVLLEHGKVLVHCTGGLNRSSLVTVEILVQLGFPRCEAVTILREQRDEFCLCNRHFERHALREFLPTAENSIFAIEDESSA